MNLVKSATDHLADLHPAVAAWFRRSFSAPTAGQTATWPAVQASQHVLLAAPTGSGKTLAAFLAAIDSLVRQAVEGELPDETQIVYVSPLKALSNDIQKNLDVPLAGIREQLAEQGFPDIEIRAWVRTGDTPPSERVRMRKRPPHILITTPESLYVLLGSDSGRQMLATTRTVIIDEIHAVAPNKRGAHLALSLARLDALCKRPVVRIGLSATQKPIDLVAKFLTGTAQPPSSGSPCKIIDIGHSRKRDLAIEVPRSPLQAVMSAEVWREVYDRLAELIRQHQTTIVFVNTRRMSERVTRELSDRIGADVVTTHHGSMAKEKRLDAEQRLKAGKLKALVATASLELGIDIGDVDLVCQLGSPRAIGTFLQRVGRSGHAVSGTPKGRLFPLSLDDLVECTALLNSIARGELDQLVLPDQPLDVLAQQIVAEVSSQEWSEDELFTLVCSAYPYRALSREDFTAVVQMLAEGFSTRRGRRGALVHRDVVNGVLRGRRGARMTGLTSGGTIPDTADFQVLLEPENHVVGTVNEDFAVESLAGDIFQLGNHSYQIQRVERGVVRVQDARGMPPTIPFWLGEAPGRSDELSFSASRLRKAVDQRLDAGQSVKGAVRWLIDDIGLEEGPAQQLADYLAATRAAFGCMPSQDTIVFERFFDEAGGMQLVIHSPYGSRINRAWGLALRKRFCRQFNFELQAAATEDNIVLSLTTAHSFELGDVQRYLNPETVRTLLIQALLDAPMFITRWRWVAGVSLALPRFRGGKKTPSQLTRMAAEDLIVSVFPDQLACAENLVGEREIPDHPLVRQTISDCLTDAMDIQGLERLLTRLASGAVTVVACDLAGPSPAAAEALAARPYAYLDDAPLEERRTQAVMARRWATPSDAAALGRLDGAAVERVKTEAWPEPANADELHDSLVWLGFISEAEASVVATWLPWLRELAKQKRVTLLQNGSVKLWVSAERLGQFLTVWPEALLSPIIAPVEDSRQERLTDDEAVVEIVRGRLEGQGPLTALEVSSAAGLEDARISAALVKLEGEGFALRGRFSPGVNVDQWCERRLLARIHRYTLESLRAQIEPVAARDFMRFLFSWQHVSGDARMQGSNALDAVLAKLEGFEAAAGAWEGDILSARIADYDHDWLDERCLSGSIAWARLRPANGANGGRGAVKATPITFFPRKNSSLWRSLSHSDQAKTLSTRTQAVVAFIQAEGASFIEEIVEGTGLFVAQVEESLSELIALGMVHSDSFGGIRSMLRQSARVQRSSRRKRRPNLPVSGRWALLKSIAASGSEKFEPQAIEHLVKSLLRRYGVVFWRVIEREAEWLPPWRELLYALRRMEARGEVRGGRFVAGFSGEQFALPEAIGMLRDTRRRPQSDELILVSGVDPLNLAGIITAGPKVASLAGNRVLYRDGVPIAYLSANEVDFDHAVRETEQWRFRNLLLQHSAGAITEPLDDEARAPTRTEQTNLIH